MKTINEVLANYHRIEDALIESGGEITEEIQSMLNDHDATFEAKVDQYAGFIAHLKAQNAHIDNRVKQLSQRKKSNLNAIESLRERLLWAMQSENRDKVKTVEFTAFIKDTEVATVDVDAIPEDLFAELTVKGYLQYERRFDKAALKKEYRNYEFILLEDKKVLNLR